MFTEVFYGYKTEKTYLNRADSKPRKPCSDEHAEEDFGKCLKDAIERKYLKCTIPDMTSGVPKAPVGKHTMPLCSTPEQYANYKHWFNMGVAFSSEGRISKTFGCLPKCKGVPK